MDNINIERIEEYTSELSSLSRQMFDINTRIKEIISLIKECGFNSPLLEELFSNESFVEKTTSLICALEEEVNADCSMNCVYAPPELMGGSSGFRD